MLDNDLYSEIKLISSKKKYFIHVLLFSLTLFQITNNIPNHKYNLRFPDSDSDVKLYRPFIIRLRLPRKEAQNRGEYELIMSQIV